MTRSKLTILVGCGLLVTGLSGCGSAAETNRTAPKVEAVKVGNPYDDRLRALNDLDRGLALRRALQDEGNKCKKVERSGYQEPYKNLSMWVLRCSDTGDWAAFIAPNGDVQTRPCQDLEGLGLPICRVDDLPAQAGEGSSVAR